MGVHDKVQEGSASLALFSAAAGWWANLQTNESAPVFFTSSYGRKLHVEISRQSLEVARGKERRMEATISNTQTKVPERLNSENSHLGGPE